MLLIELLTQVLSYLILEDDDDEPSPTAGEAAGRAR